MIRLLSRTNTTVNLDQDPKVVIELRRRSYWEWARVSTKLYFGETRIKLDYSGFVSLYDRLDSLDHIRLTQPHRAQHRLAGISDEDVKIVFQRIKSALKPKNEIEWGQSHHSIDWSNIVQDLINHYQARLRELSYLLNQNLIKPTREAHRISYAMLMPYLDTSDQLNSSKTLTLQKCVNAFTHSLGPSLSESDHVLRDAVRGVLKRICPVVLKVFWETLDPVQILLSDVLQSQVMGWKIDLEELLNWLGWPNKLECHQPCKPNVSEICL